MKLFLCQQQLKPQKQIKQLMIQIFLLSYFIFVGLYSKYSYSQNRFIYINLEQLVMRKILFPLEKLAILFFFLELIIQVDKITYALCSLFIVMLSIQFQGARPYTPFIIIVVIAEMLSLGIFQAIILLVLLFLIFILKVYDINIPMKGPCYVGHIYQQLEVKNKNLLLSLYYPTLEKSKKTEWIPKQRDYNKVLYEIFHVDPKARRIPYQIFKFVNSYIHKIYLPVEHQSPYLKSTENQFQLPDSVKQNQSKIVIFSHGLGSHLNAYSSIVGNWASQGYTVISINHDNDQVCLDHRVVKKNQAEPDQNYQKQITEFLHKNRNRDLKVRVDEVLSVIQIVLKQGFMKHYLNVDIEVEQIILAGHSYGGGTAIATKAELNKIYRSEKKILEKIKRLVCLDPWIFPFDQEVFDNLSNQNILIVNSQHFYEEVPYIYEIELLYAKLIKNNPTIKSILVKKMDHISQCDMAYVFGSILKITGTVKLSEFSDYFMTLNILICQLYLDGKGKEQIIEISNRYVLEKKMNLKGVRVLQQYRTTRELTFGRVETKEEHQIKNKI